MITASVGAAILKESPYQKMNDVLLDKLGRGFPYKENKFVHHGKKYEKIATMIYESLYNTKVGEFGLIPYQSKHLNSPFIGASPDGINSPITLDCKPNKKINTMLEIKCPLSRKIKTSGKIDGTICPHHYWIQIQLQLACCDLDDCDFWQCYINDCTYEEFKSVNTAIITEEQNSVITEYNNNIIQGCIIQFLPKNRIDKEDDKIEWYAKYIYPVDVMMSVNEYEKWANTIIENYKVLYPELVNDYYYDKIIYWKLINAHNVNIKRDYNWFKMKHSSFNDFWNKVIYYRNNPFDNDRKTKRQKYLDSDLFLNSDDSTN
jgi:putative phage-type endonuclease